MRIVEIGGQEAFALLQAKWRALQAQCPQATPFQTWEWNAAWWRHFGARKRLRVLLFWSRPLQDSGRRRGEESDSAHPQEILVGIAPFYTSFHLGTPLRRLAWVGTGQSDYLGPLALPEWETAVAQTLHAYIKETLRGWDMADLQQLRPDALLLAQTASGETRRGGDMESVLPMEPCPYLALPADWKNFTARLGKKMRSNLGYYDRLLQKTFQDVSYHTADAATLNDGMTALFELHQKRWNARWLPGVLGNRRVQAFHREVAQSFLENGWLRLHLLTLDGVIRASLYCFTYADRTFYYLGGFAPELSKFSLGTLLTAQAIRQSIEQGCAEFDFLRGNEPYKYRWLPEVRINQRLLLLRSHEHLGGLGELPGRAGFALNRVERYVTLRAKAFAEQQGRKERSGTQAGSAPAPAQESESSADSAIASRP